MAGKFPPRNPVPVSDLVGAILDPVLRKRAGINVGLVQSWEEIVGPRLADRSRPERIQWPRRMGPDDPFEPAVLVVACDSMAALHIQHETGAIVARINDFLGFAAIGRIRIVQKPVAAAGPPPRKLPRDLKADEAEKLSRTVSGVEDEGLRAALQRLGAAVIGSKPRA